jgi:hypothetical protein
MGTHHQALGFVSKQAWQQRSALETKIFHVLCQEVKEMGGSVKLAGKAPLKNPKPINSWNVIFGFPPLRNCHKNAFTPRDKE